jgi:hypothetical protein
VGHDDRLHRNVTEQQQFAAILVAYGAKFAVPGKGLIDLSSDDGEFMAALGALLARKEVRRKAQRQKDAHKQMVESVGRPWWPARPFGFTADPHPLTGRWWTIQRDSASKEIIAVNKIRKHPQEAKLVRDAYRQFNAGASIRSIVAGWNEKDITTPLGNAWSSTAVRDLLLTERNAGLREYGGREYEGTWPRLVEPDTWRMAVRKLNNPERRCGVDRGRKHLLSGIAICGRCDATLTSTVNARKQRQYVCINCNKIARNGDKVDAIIIEAVVRRLSREDAVDLLRPKVDEVDAEALREERRALRDKLKQLGKDFATAPPEFTQAALAEINGRLDEIDKLLTDPGKARVFEGLIGVKDVRKAFASLDLGRRRTVVDTLMTITINPAKAGPVFDPDSIDAPWK